jgi:protein gp37
MDQPQADFFKVNVLPSVNRTSIEYCDFTANPIRFGNRGELFFDEAVLQQVLRRRKPATIFWCDRRDLFGSWVPDAWRDRCAAVVSLTPHLRHLWLTKRARRMRECWEAHGHGFMPSRISSAALDLMLPNDLRRLQWDLPGWPLPNLGLGVSVENQQAADERISDLLATPAAMRFVSLEPLLSSVDLGRYLSIHCVAPRDGRNHKVNMPGDHHGDRCMFALGLDWVVLGGESRPGARPMPTEWARSVRDQCISAGIPYFHKQNGEWSTVPDGPVTIRTKHHDVPVGDGTHHRMFRVGKRAAGRLLDGKVWDERPEGWGCQKEEGESGKKPQVASLASSGPTRKVREVR